MRKVEKAAVIMKMVSASSRCAYSSLCLLRVRAKSSMPDHVRKMRKGKLAHRNMTVC